MSSGHRVLVRVADRLLDAAGARSRPARQRVAMTDFFLGTTSFSDRVIVRTYFGLAARRWAVDQSGEDRLAPLAAGFAHVPGDPRVVVELGCGAGRSAAEAAGRWPAATVRGYDISGPMVRAARRAHGSDRVSFSRSSAGRVADQADLVFMCNYLPNPGVVAKIVRPGGHALVVSSFQNSDRALAAPIWAAHGFRAVAGDDVGEGSFEVYQRS